MKKNLEILREYTHRMTIADVALLKLCLAALGVIIGLALPKKHRDTALAIAAPVFGVTYLCSLTRFICGVRRLLKEQQAE